MKLKLIEGWRQAWKFWSLRLNTLGTILLSTMVTWPESVLTLWSFLPDDVRAVLPPRVALVIPLICFALSMGARMFKQEKLDDKKG